MNTLSDKDITDFISANIDSFHKKRYESMIKLKLESVLRRKNPYLFKAKNVITSHELVKSIVDAHLSSQEETIFGDFLEKLAIFVCSKVYGGVKSGVEGIDLEFEKDEIRYLISIKSGPNWGNSSQISKMKDYFRKAAKTLRTNSPKQNVIAVNGCCYGRDSKPQKDEYIKYCGQMFWEFISGDSGLYLRINKPLGYQARQKNEMFMERYSELLNQFTASFTNRFCTKGKIDWDKLVEFNSKNIS